MLGAFAHDFRRAVANLIHEESPSCHVQCLRYGVWPQALAETGATHKCVSQPRRSALSLPAMCGVTIGKALPKRDFNLDKGGGGGRVNGCDNPRNVGPDQAPSALTQDHNRNLAALEVLLVAEILIGCEQDFKARALGLVQ